ncbi:MAG TPA: hypothetical protein VF534_17825 [Paraburkholderia sp.]
MGQHANQRVWLEFERIDRQRQERSFEVEPELTEAERASEWDDEAWQKIDATADELAEARRAYARPVWGGSLMDEMGMGR